MDSAKANLPASMASPSVPKVTAETRARQPLRTLGAVGRVEDIAAITIPLDDRRYVRLGQVASVTNSHADRSTLAFLDGQPVIAFQGRCRCLRAKGWTHAGGDRRQASPGEGPGRSKVGKTALYAALGGGATKSG